MRGKFYSQKDLPKERKSTGEGINKCKININFSYS